MLKLSATKSLRGEITVPGDKSISHRAVLFASIADGRTSVINFQSGQDCMSTISCFRNMGVDIEIADERVLIHGKGMYGLKKPDKALYTGNSGTTTRLLTGLLAAQSFDSVIDGDASIRTRPMNRVIAPLSLMGADITATNREHCPLEIKGKKLFGINYTLPVPSAQLKSALILAGLYAQGETVISEPVKSRNHTELMLGAFGANYKVNGSEIHIRNTQNLNSCEIEVPGDISSAAFFIVAGLICENSEIVIKNVGINETRTGILTVLKKMGGIIQMENIKHGYEPTSDLVVKSSSLTGTEISGDIIPSLIDEIPAIAVAAAFASGTTVVSGAGELKHKETNRIETVVSELKKANVNIHETEDGFVIHGGNRVLSGSFNSHGDHRIAMAMSVLALAAEGVSTIENEAAAYISYPSYYDDLKSMLR